MRTSLFIGLGFLLAACATDEPAVPVRPTTEVDDSLGRNTVPVPDSEAFAASRARAVIQPVGDSGIEGQVDFTRMGTGVRVLAFVQGLDDGLFGFHVHERSSCGRPGEHFNPSNAPHGDPSLSAHHRPIGALGNIRSARSRARYDRIDTILRMDSTNSLVGRVVAIHSGQDDLNTQPDGGAGEMVACGVIEAR